MLSSIKAEINEAYADHLEVVDSYNLKSFRDENNNKDVFLYVKGEEESCIKVTLTVAVPAEWEGDHLTAFAIGHLADLNVMEPLMGSIHDLFVKDMKHVKPVVSPFNIYV